VKYSISQSCSLILNFRISLAFDAHLQHRLKFILLPAAMERIDMEAFKTLATLHEVFYRRHSIYPGH